MSVSVLLHSIAGASAEEEAFLRESVALLRKAVAMPGFGGSVRNAPYDSAAWQGINGSIRQLSGIEIWDRIITGREYGNTGDHAIDLSIKVDDLREPGEEPGMIAATRLGTLPICISRWFLARCIAAGDRVNMAAQIMHQWMHVSGFVHQCRSPERDAPSVLAGLVRETLSRDHADEIDAEITELSSGADCACDCCPGDLARVA